METWSFGGWTSGMYSPTNFHYSCKTNRVFSLGHYTFPPNYALRIPIGGVMNICCEINADLKGFSWWCNNRPKQNMENLNLDILDEIAQFLNTMPWTSVKLHWLKSHQSQYPVTIVEAINANRDLRDKKLLQGSSRYKPHGLALLFPHTIVSLITED